MNVGAASLFAPNTGFGPSLVATSLGISTEDLASVQQKVSKSPASRQKPGAPPTAPSGKLSYQPINLCVHPLEDGGVGDIVGLSIPIWPVPLHTGLSVVVDFQVVSHGGKRNVQGTCSALAFERRGILEQSQQPCVCSFVAWSHNPMRCCMVKHSSDCEPHPSIQL